jgi:prepilin-type N-terminal cleavage/methylation domain-containing protein
MGALIPLHTRTTSKVRLPLSTFVRAQSFGFTILEMIVVLALIVIIAGLSFVSYSKHISNNRLAVNLHNTQAFFDHARLTAQALNHETVVSINLNTNGGGQFYLIDPSQNVSEKRLIQQMELDPGLPVTINPRFLQRIVFTPKGAIKLYTASSLKLSTQNCKFTLDFLQNNVTVNLIIYANTGMAHIVKD